jgi:hypothetical protein
VCAFVLKVGISEQAAEEVGPNGENNRRLEKIT